MISRVRPNPSCKVFQSICFLPDLCTHTPLLTPSPKPATLALFLVMPWGEPELKYPENDRNPTVEVRPCYHPSSQTEARSEVDSGKEDRGQECPGGSLPLDAGRCTCTAVRRAEAEARTPQRMPGSCCTLNQNLSAFCADASPPPHTQHTPGIPLGSWDHSRPQESSCDHKATAGNLPHLFFFPDFET